MKKIIFIMLFLFVVITLEAQNRYGSSYTFRFNEMSKTTEEYKIKTIFEVDTSSMVVKIFSDETQYFNIYEKNIVNDSEMQFNCVSEENDYMVIDINLNDLYIKINYKDNSIITDQYKIDSILKK